MIDKRVLKSLTKAVGRGAVLSHPADLVLYSYDSSTARGTPDAVVFPSSTEQVARVVKLCAERRIPFVARGAGTNLSGGSAPLRGGVVITLSRLNRVLEIDAANQRVVVQPGVVNLDLQAMLAPYGFQFCPDPASQKVSTIGGNVAENAGGPHCLKYGVTTNHVLGLTVVTPQGEVRQFGGRTLDLPGYDLVGLFVGSEGTFGIATEMVLKLRPLPESTQVVLALFDTLEAAGEAVTQIIAVGIVATALEIMDRNTIAAVEASFPTGIPTDVEAFLLIEVDGLTEALDRQAEQCAEICRKLAARSVEIGQTEEEKAKLWTARKSAFGATARLNPSMLVNDATVPRTRIPEVLRGIQEIERRYEVQIGKVFHAGDGNLHSNVLFDRDDPDGFRRAEAASAEIFALAAGVGGTITGEHGVGAEKPHHLRLIFSEADLEAQRRVRQVFDPLGIANPGKVLPEGRGERGQGPGARGQTPGVGEALRELEAVVGADRLITATGGVATLTEGVSAYAVDGQMPLAVAEAGSESEVAGLLRVAADRGLSVLLRGGGRQLYYGAPCGPIGLVVSLARLNKVVEYEADDLTITVQAGMTLGALRRLVGEHHQMLPLDPPGPEDATIGGIVAAGLAGPMRMRYGSPRDLVLGLRVALSTGEIIKVGGRTVKNVAGYDLTKLFIGSLGTLGAMLEVTLRLVPAPEETAMFTVTVSPARAREVTAVLLNSRLEIATCDVLSTTPWEPRPRGDSVTLYLGAMGSREAVARQERELRAMFPEGVTRVGDEAIWARVRDVAYPTGDGCLLRLSVPMAKVVDMVELIAARPGWTAAARAGDGIVYAFGPADRGTLGTLRAEAGKVGGGAVLEAGPVELKRGFPVWSAVVPNADLMRALRQTFDPTGVVGCGRAVA